MSWSAITRSWTMLGRTPGVRELIAIPLYLSVLLAGGAQGSSPATKVEVLRLFVQQHERARDHAEALQATLFGRHAEVLAAPPNSGVCRCIPHRPLVTAAPSVFCVGRKRGIYAVKSRRFR